MARSAGIHESQSRFGEVIISRSGAFAEFMAENVRKLNQVVKPGFVRVAADEVCYPIHVILRFETERALTDGEMEPEHVPQVKAYLGIDTYGRDDVRCLQDVHWSSGHYAGFSSYAIGPIFAAQLTATVKKEIGEDTVRKCIRTGGTALFVGKQREKVWSVGRTCPTTMEVVVKMSGKLPDSK